MNSRSSARLACPGHDREDLFPLERVKVFVIMKIFVIMTLPGMACPSRAAPDPPPASERQKQLPNAGIV
jgi:hypothetical protein